MDFVREMDKAISLGFEGFKAFIQQQMQTPDFLTRTFWVSKDGSQMTVLNYLIANYSEPAEAATIDESEVDEHLKMIDFVLKSSADNHVGEPLHQAIDLGKINLVFFLLGIKKSDVNGDMKKAIALLDKKKAPKHGTDSEVDKRDGKGRTLISLVLGSKNIELLTALLMKYPNIHASTVMTAAGVQYQPIHQAVVLDYADGVRLLAHRGAALANPFGSGNDTSLLLAARLCKINALDALLEQPSQSLMLEAENSNRKEMGRTAIEELCEHINNNNNKSEAILGVAMLLCRGAEPPRSDVMRDLLSNNRTALLKAIHTYLEDKPDLVEPFVKRCHLAESVLHNIVYARHSWGSAIRHLFGKPSDAAGVVENLLVRKYSNIAVAEKDVTPLSTAAAESLAAEKDPLKLYALFVRRYTEAYDSQIFTNSWSTMRWMIAKGQCDWETVLRYSHSHPTSRTRLIVNEMLNPIPKVHEEADVPTNASPLTPAM